MKCVRSDRPRDRPSGGEYPTATADQIDRLRAAAAEAHCKWSRVSTTAVRGALEGVVSALHTERRDELAGMIRREMGKPLDQALR
jgi:succinate-semialdehyde dehydrogenase/glutarate-semialdehyde dehydrogenase